MKPKRSVRLGEEILKELALLLMEKIADPRLQGVTFTYVKMTEDLKIAKIYFTTMGDQKRIKEVENALSSAKGFLKKEIALRMTLRYVPDLIFYYDETLEYGNKIDRLLEKIGDGQ